VRPYLTLDNEVDGAVLVIVDINDLKRSEFAIASARDYAENIIGTMREPLLVLDPDLRVESVNRAFYRTFGVTADDTIGKFIYELGNRQWDIPDLRALLEEILPTNHTIDDFVVEWDFERLGCMAPAESAAGSSWPSKTLQSASRPSRTCATAKNAIVPCSTWAPWPSIRAMPQV